MTENINKFIAQSGLCSRREADRLIKSGKVTINGKVAKAVDKVHDNDAVKVGDKTIGHEGLEKVYLVYNKPVGVITTTDKDAKDNIISKINYPKRIFPVGRLDVNTSGIILLTNDGSIVNPLLKGKSKLEKEYLVTVNRPINDEALKRLEKGVTLEGFKTLPAKTKRIEANIFAFIITEGKKRQVRRMCEKIGYNVTKLERIRFGNITKEDLRSGQWRLLSETEINILLDLTKRSA